MAIDFQRLSPDQVMRRIRPIATVEGIIRPVRSASESGLQDLALLVDECNGDLRSLLCRLQLTGLASKRPVVVPPFVRGAFECARWLLDDRRAPLGVDERIDLASSDGHMLALLVAENYVNHEPLVADGDCHMTLRALAKASESLSAADELERFVPGVVAHTVGTVTATFYARGGRVSFRQPGEQNFARFPAWLGHHSTCTKRRRQLAELLSPPGALRHRRADGVDYARVVRTAVLKPLQDGDACAAARVMARNGLKRHDLDALLDVTRFKSRAAWAVDVFGGVPAAIKARFTRAVHASESVDAVVVADASKRKARATGRPARASKRG